MDIIKEYLDGNSIDKISKKHNISYKRVSNFLHENNIPIRSNKENSRRYSCNFDFFENIDTEHKAYWLGFIAADGYISCNRKHSSDAFGISIGIVDKEHLDKLNKDLESNHPIHEYEIKQGYKVGNKYVRLLISNNKMVSDLKKHGIKEHKSLTIEFPETVPEELMCHYLRGYFDGNGSWSRNQGKNFWYAFDLTSTKEFLTGTCAFLGLPCVLSQRFPERKKNNYRFRIDNREKVWRIMELFYSEATVYLDRKYERYLLAKTSPYVQGCA